MLPRKVAEEENTKSILWQRSAQWTSFVFHLISWLLLNVLRVQEYLLILHQYWPSSRFSSEITMGLKYLYAITSDFSFSQLPTSRQIELAPVHVRFRLIQVRHRLFGLDSVHNSDVKHPKKIVDLCYAR